MVHIDLDRPAIDAFCRKWRIAEFALFGSVLRDDFRPGSDIDVLVSFAPDSRWGLFDIVRMEDELSGVFGRKVDLVDRQELDASPNYIRRRSILESLEPIHVAR